MVHHSLLDDPQRLEAVQVARILDSPTQGALDDLAMVAARTMGAPIALVSLVDRDEQCFVGQHGLAEPWASRRVTPLSHSFCRHVVAHDDRLLIDDAADDLEHATNLAVRDLDVRAYAGVPVRTRQGTTLGSFCTLDHDPRGWSEDDVAKLEQLAKIAAGILDAHVDRHFRRLAEQRVRQLGKMDALGRFAAGIARDLTDVVTVMHRQADVLDRHANDPERVVRSAEELRSAAASAARRRDLLMQCVRPEPTSQDPARIDAREALIDLEPALRATLGSRIEQRTQITDEPLPVAIPRARFDQIVLDLVTNARDAIEDRGRCLVRLHAGDDPEAPTAVLEVEDDGCGMPPDIAARVFEPFYTTKPPGQGDGIGLSNVWNVVTTVGGTIVVASRPGRGTKVRVVLPCATEEPDALRATG